MSRSPTAADIALALLIDIRRDLARVIGSADEADRAAILNNLHARTERAINTLSVMRTTREGTRIVQPQQETA